MIGFVKKTVLGTALAASALTGVMAGAAPAQAHDYDGGYRGHGNVAGAAVAGGIIGLALGAAIASSDRPEPVYAEPVYAEPAYAPPVYYAAPPVPAAYVNAGWVWRDGYFWDGYGHRFYRDGRPCIERGYWGGGYARGWGHEGGWRDHGGWRGYEHGGWGEHGGWRR